MNPNLAVTAKDESCKKDESSLQTKLKDLRDRIEEIGEKLAEESWLPMGLRTRLAEELASIRLRAEEDQVNYGELAQRIHSMALMAYAYGDSVLRSNTVKCIRALDLELESIRLKEGLQPLKDFDFGEFETLLQEAG